MYFRFIVVIVLLDAEVDRFCGIAFSRDEIFEHTAVVTRHYPAAQGFHISMTYANVHTVAA
jgi:hypothetical protein